MLSFNFYHLNKNIKQCKEFLPKMDVGNKIKSCKKILINQAEKGYGVSDHYVNSLKHLYVYVSNDIMQYLSSVKRRETVE